jgi:hypothetical protein
MLLDSEPRGSHTHRTHIHTRVRLLNTFLYNRVLCTLWTPSHSVENTEGMPDLPVLSKLGIDTVLQPPPLAPPPVVQHVGERGGPWDSVALNSSFHPALQTSLPMTIIYTRDAALGWLPYLLVAESTLLIRAGASRGLGVYALKRFRGPREPGENNGDVIGHYGGTVLASASTRKEANERAQTFVQQGRQYLLAIRIHGHAGWYVVDGEHQSVLPMLNRVNDPRGTPFAPRCTVSEFGAFRAARDIPPLDWTRPLSEQAASELSFEYGDSYWETHRLLGSAELPLSVDVVFESLNIGCNSQPRRSSRLTDALESPQPPMLERVETDREGRVVYVDLEALGMRLPLVATYAGPLDILSTSALHALRTRLSTLQPTQHVLGRMPLINRNRVLVEVEDTMAFDLFRAWVVATASSSSTMGEGLRQLLRPLGPRLLLLGGHFICPRVTEYEPYILQQKAHTDVGTRGEVIGIGINLNNEFMNTLLDPHATLDSNGEVQGGIGFRRAATSIFGFETAAVHAGPGISRVNGPFPRFLTNRIFFLLCADDLDPGKVTKHRADNGLIGSANLIITMPTLS